MLTSLYVAAAMPKGVRTRILDEDVEPIDFDCEADLVGISFMTHNAPRAYEIADEFRRRGRPVVLGGYHPTFLPEEAAAHGDAVCVGEAEGTVPRMMADFLGGRLEPRYVSEPVDLRGLPPRVQLLLGVLLRPPALPEAAGGRGDRGAATAGTMAHLHGRQPRPRSRLRPRALRSAWTGIAPTSSPGPSTSSRRHGSTRCRPPS
jgi:hypothetical protein